jgi:cupin fold WbuC family metalloprotein
MKTFPRTLIDELAAKAAASPRKRAHHNVHEHATDLVQRFFVVAQRDSYIRPHRHLVKSELAMVLRGQIDVLTFDADGRVLARYTAGEGTSEMGYETPCGTWHTLVVTSDVAAFLEVKEGPYDPKTAVEFAPWAPPEGDATTGQFLERLRAAQVGTTLRA